MLNLGDIFLNIKANVGPVNQANASIARLNKTAKAGTKETGFLGRALDNAAKSAQLTEGPLSGIASRLTTLKSVAASGTLALTGATLALAGFTSVAYSAGRSFLAAEDGLVVLENAIQSTGRSSEISLKQADDLAKAFDNLTVGRQAVTSALSFTNIPTAQLQDFLGTAEDLSKALGRDLQGTVISLAKAIQAPASALDGLGRAGIFFTKIQRENLQLLVDTGRVGEATSTILATLKERFKGVAVDRGASGELERLTKNAQLFQESIFRNTGAGKALEGTLANLANLFQQFGEKGNLASRIGNLVTVSLENINKAIVFVTTNAEKFLQIIKIIGAVALAAMIKSMLTSIGVIQLLGRVFLTLTFVPAIFTGIITAVKAAGLFMVGFYGILAAGAVPIAALVAGVALIAYSFGDTVKAVKGYGEQLVVFWETVKKKANEFVDGVVKAFNDMVKPIEEVFEKIKKPLESFTKPLGEALDYITGKVSKFTGSLVEDVTKGLGDTGSAIANEFKRGVASTGELFKPLVESASESGTKIVSTFEEAKNTVGRFFIEVSKNPLGAAAGLADKFFDTIGGGINVVADMAGLTYDANTALNSFNDALNKTTESARVGLASLDPFLTSLDTFAAKSAIAEAGLNSLYATIEAQKALGLDEEEIKKLINFDEEVQNLNNSLRGTLEIDFANKFGMSFQQFSNIQGKLSDNYADIASKTSDVREKTRQLELAQAKLTDTLKAARIEQELILDAQARGITLPPATLDVEQINILEGAKTDLAIQIAELKNPILKGANQAIEGLGSSLSDKFAAKLMGDDNTSFRDIARDFTTKLLQSFISELLINPLVKDLKGLMTQVFSTDAGASTGAAALRGSQGGLGGLLGLGASIFSGGGLGAASSVGAAATGAGSFGVLASDSAAFSLPGFAKGGMPQLNRPSIVGENGPELFVPKRKGTVIPNGQSADTGSGQTNMINFNITTQDANSFKQARGRITQDLQRSLRNS